MFLEADFEGPVSQGMAGLKGKVSDSFYNKKNTIELTRRRRRQRSRRISKERKNALKGESILHFVS